MGAKLIPALLVTALLCGCTQECEYVPYALQADGTSRYPGEAYTSHQVLQWCEGTADRLNKRELYFYDGSIYALSNYRAYLQANGFTEESLRQTDTLLDSVLTDGNERVRLIYQSTGTIRILLENSDGLAHILLEGI